MFHLTEHSHIFLIEKNSGGDRG